MSSCWRFSSLLSTDWYSHFQIFPFLCINWDRDHSAREKFGSVWVSQVSCFQLQMNLWVDQSWSFLKWFLNFCWLSLWSRSLHVKEVITQEVEILELDISQWLRSMQFRLTSSQAIATTHLIINHIPTFKVTNNSVNLDQPFKVRHISLMATISRLDSIKDLDNNRDFHLLVRKATLAVLWNISDYDRIKSICFTDESFFTKKVIHIFWTKWIFHYSQRIIDRDLDIFDLPRVLYCSRFPMIRIRDEIHIFLLRTFVSSKFYYLANNKKYFFGIHSFNITPFYAIMLSSIHARKLK